MNALPDADQAVSTAQPATFALDRSTMKRFGNLLLLATLAVVNTLGQEGADQSTITFHSSSSLVLVDVLALDQKTGLSIADLKREDFQVFDNGQPVSIATFDTGAQHTRPIALWFVVICNMQNMSTIRSGAFAGHETLFRSALDNLDQDDKVGVAHWCDNGDAELDQVPTLNRDLAISSLARTLEMIPFIGPNGSRVGELAVQETFRAIIRDAYAKDRQPLPVVVILHGDNTGMPVKELDRIVDDFLETSGIVFGIKDASTPDMRILYSEQGAIFHYMSEATGGHYVSVPPNQYATALDEIISQLHHRYQLGFKPPAIDGKRHKLRVILTGDARDSFKKVRLRFRPEYIPDAAPPSWEH